MSPGGTGARAIARGGDSQSCDATVRLNSTILDGGTTSLDAAGEPGGGADPRDGVARFEIAYSNFDPATVRQSGPAEVETTSPGGNVFGLPRFNPRSENELSWDSPLIDRGDPAGLDDWDGLFRIVNGRRDIGLREYQFDTPRANLVVEPFAVTRPGRTVRIAVGATDLDLDPLSVRLRLSNGRVREYQHVGQVPAPRFRRRYARLGSYVEEVTVTDPTGRSASARAVVRVRRQRMEHVSVRPRRVRPRRAPDLVGRASLRFRTSVPDRVRFRVERAVPRRRGRGIRWARTRYRFTLRSFPGTTVNGFTGWFLGRFDGYSERRRLRPGRYRLVAAPRGVRPMRARFRIVR
jgi:hypothetical protein